MRSSNERERPHGSKGEKEKEKEKEKGKKHGGHSEHDEPDEYAYLHMYNVPSQVMLLEKCDGTIDSLIDDDDFSDAEMNAMFAQIVMTLAVYQKVYRFTHNDLHCNNIMYVKTDRPHLIYCVNKTYYKVPTYGRIYKIIDFGRAIYTFRGQLCMGDCYARGNVASNQYNCGPYQRDDKPVIEPNYSFDLCRFACSIFDCIIDEEDEVATVKCPLKRLVMRWCLDDAGKSVLYKRNEIERYPDFKLYKMIARIVHKHTPEAALKDAAFKKYVVTHASLNKKARILNVDRLPELWRAPAPE